MFHDIKMGITEVLNLKNIDRCQKLGRQGDEMHTIKRYLVCIVTYIWKCDVPENRLRLTNINQIVIHTTLYTV